MSSACYLEARLTVRLGEGDYEHNLRLKNVEHADIGRIVENRVFKRETLEEAFHVVFSEAEQVYRSRLKEGRKWGGYLEQCRGYKNPRLNSEILVMIGNKYNCGLGKIAREIARDILTEYMELFEEENPHLHVYCAVLHMDEETPHLHIMILPFADGYTRGMPRQISLSGALEAQGFKKGKYQTSEWKDTQRKILGDIMLENGIMRVPDLGLRRAHLPIEMYKAYMENLDNRIHELPDQINRLRKKGPEVTVWDSELNDLEERAKISPLFVENATELVEALEEEKKACKKYRRFLHEEYEKIEEERAEMEKASKKAGYLEEENLRLNREVDVLGRRCNLYEAERDAERERTSVAKRERDTSNKALAEVTKAVSMLIDPNAFGYEIQNLDLHSRKVLQAVVRRGKRALKESEIDLDTSMDGDIYSVRLPDGVGRELYMLNEQEEDLEL